MSHGCKLYDCQVNKIVGLGEMLVGWYVRVRTGHGSNYECRLANVEGKSRYGSARVCVCARYFIFLSSLPSNLFIQRRPNKSRVKLSESHPVALFAVRFKISPLKSPSFNHECAGRRAVGGGDEGSSHLRVHQSHTDTVA